MTQNRHHQGHHHDACPCCAFLPPYVVRRLSESDDPALRKLAFDTIQADVANRLRRDLSKGFMGRSSTPGVGYRRYVHDMGGADAPLPGTLVRNERQDSSGNALVDEAFEHAGIAYGFFKKVLKRESLDNAGLPLISSVNFGFEVANAFWEGTQMVYGSGDGHYFLPFTRSLSIAAHEMTHGVISFSSGLAYRGESGALNESFCDAMGTSVEQWHLGQTVDDASWMMGREVAGPGLGELAGFRSFTAEQAYQGHPVLGDDLQPKHMNAFVVTTDDNGGVHINSGIPNHVFYRVAMTLGGKLWDQTAPIWYEAFTKDLNAQATFIKAATATQLAARRLFGDTEAKAVADAWAAVGVQSEV